MTHKEETVFKTYSKGFITALGVLTVTIICTGFAFYFNTKANDEAQSREITELKSIIRKASPQEIGRIKYDLNKMQQKIEDLSVQINSTTRVMESFKQDMERKSDKMLELLIEIKRQP